MNDLIENHFPMCDRRLFDMFDKEGKLLAREVEVFQKPGVYILYEGRTPYYIGKAKKLWSRLHDHANKSTDDYFLHWNYFQAFMIADPAHRSEIEGILCASFPTANKSTKKFPKTVVPAKLRTKIREATRKQYTA